MSLSKESLQGHYTKLTESRKRGLYRKRYINSSVYFSYLQTLQRGTWRACLRDMDLQSQQLQRGGPISPTYKGVGVPGLNFLGVVILDEQRTEARHCYENVCPSARLSVTLVSNAYTFLDIEILSHCILYFFNFIFIFF